MAYWYAVLNGREPGVYKNWGRCRQEVHGYSNAFFRKFDTREEAENYFDDEMDDMDGPPSQGYGPPYSGYGPRPSGFGPQSSGFGPQSSDFGPQSSGFGRQSSGFGPGPSGFGPPSPGYGRPPSRRSRSRSPNNNVRDKLQEVYKL